MRLEVVPLILLLVWKPSQFVDSSKETSLAKNYEREVSVGEWYKDAQHYWPLESTTYEILRDSKGRNHGRVYGEVRSIPGIVGDALEISGNNNTWVDFGRIPGTCLNDPMACENGFTIAFWLKLPTFQGNKVIIQLGHNRHSRGLTIWMRRRKDKKINFRVNTIGKKFQSMLTWPNNHWTHVTLIWRKEPAPELNVYFNCTMTSRAIQADPLPKEKKKISKDLKKVSLILGASHGRSKNSHVIIDELAVWNSTLTDEHICQIMRVTSVHGGYSEWSEFSACSKSCGNGTRSRNRTCTNPKPRNRGLDCSNLGPSQEIAPCPLRPCPIHGNYTQWSVFSSCSKTCGSGLRHRNRTCTNPVPEHGGNDCSLYGLDYESVSCKIQHCRVDGGYTMWSEFTKCNVTCGDGVQTRNRTCSNPSPNYGGQNCSHLGEPLEVRICSLKPCAPIDGGYMKWRTWTQCTRSCGGGYKYRTRKCENPKPKYGGRNCSRLGVSFQSTRCKLRHCPVDGKYTEWSQWSGCTKPCENGTSMRIRTCTNPEPKHGGSNCSGAFEETEVQICNPHRCPIHGGYTEWSVFTICNQTCGGGIKTRNRTCSNPVPRYNGNNCSVIGRATESLPCNTKPCPVHGNYTSWTNFTECTKSCENGTRFRYRNCTNPAPLHGGRNCTHLGKAEEYEYCNTHMCPIHGGYTEWTNFTLCSKSCGNGTMRRNRTCTNPVPEHGGKDCKHLGLSLEIISCNTHPCPIHGNYTSWSSFSNCSKLCGNGTRYRFRNCTSPTPLHGGYNCSYLGKNIEIEFCNTHYCPVDGGYTMWSNFTECSKSCNNGTSSRNRTCTNPEPKHGGHNCSILGPSLEIISCNAHFCPIHGGFTSWSDFSSCTKSCGNGTRSRHRNCTNPIPQHNGNNCTIFGSNIKTEACNTFHCPVHGGYSPWSEFSECSKTCGLGETVRTRNCTNPVPKHGGMDCKSLGAAAQKKICVRVYNCPIDGNYSQWSTFGECTKSCGNGTTTRTRSCSNPAPQFGGQQCHRFGSNVETKSCNEHPCPINGGYTLWSPFSLCTKLCGGGTSTRFRNCTNPIPQHGGANCSALGPNLQVKSCNVDPCPIHGGYTEWSEFSPCDKLCGKGRKRKERTCTNPLPQHGGRDCSHLGSLAHEISCNIHPCPINGSYSAWSDWSACDKTCNNGTKLRTRLCNNPSPKYGGRNCSVLGPSREYLTCFLKNCPIDGGYGNWSGYTLCTRTCGTGVRYRTRQCNSPKPKYDGRSCARLGASNETSACNTIPCPIDGNYTEWSGYQQCSVTCDGGLRLRVRNCTNPKPMYGGRNCSILGPSRQVIPCNQQRCPDIVFNVTLNLTEETWDPLLEVKGSASYLLLKNRIVRDIDFLYYADQRNRKQLENVKVWRFRQGSVLADLSLFYNNKHYRGITLLYDAFYGQDKFTYLPARVVNISTFDVPSKPPQDVTGHNSSSTSIQIHWKAVDKSFANGDITGYRISLEEIKTTKRTRRSTQQSAFAYVNTDGAVNSYNVTRLQKYSRYKIRVAGRNRRGVGIESDPIEVITDEDKPTSSPNQVTAFNTSSTSIAVEWTALPEGSIPGILRGYRLFYSPVSNNAVVDFEGHKDVDSKKLKTIVDGLDKYTKYRVDVSGFTSKGFGPSSQVIVWTNEDVPSKPPQNLTAYNTSSTSIYLEWQPIPSKYIHGILRGYTLSFVDNEAQEMDNWTDIHFNSSTGSYLIISLEKYTKYCLQVSGVTIKGEGTPTKSVCLHTDEDKPDGFPHNVTGVPKTSTELYVEWQHITRKQWNGISRGYRVFYKPEGHKHWLFKDVKPTTYFLTLRGLLKFMWYDIKIAAFTSKGIGPHSPHLRLRTKEDVPSRPVIQLTAFHTSHTSLLVKWKPIKEGYIHGVLRGFRIIYWVKGSPEEDQISTVAGPNQLQATLKDLLIFTTYGIQMVGFTSVGEGAVSKDIYARTDQHTPGASPINLFSANKSGPYHLNVTWDPIPNPYDVHGILLGYRVFYTPVAVSNKTLKPPRPWSIQTVGPRETRTIIRNLTTFTRYHVTVLAFTVKGDGVRSANVTVETCNCNGTFYTNWWASPPYVENPESYNNTGIIPTILNNVIRTCCGNCSAFESSVTEIDYHFGGAKKKGLQMFRDSIDQSIELSFPVYGFMSQTRYSGDFGFVPLVQSPGVALIVIGDEEGTAARLLIRSIMLCWPIILLDMMLLWVMSIVIWFVETYTNSRHFPHFILHGIWEGMWWAFASMTTLGYGDRIPRSYIGRLIGVIWILIGVILIACFNSTMTTLLTARILDKEVMLYGTKVAAIQNSSEYRLGVRKNAFVNPTGKEYSNLGEVYEALVNRDVKAVLVDAYTVGSRKKLFSRPDLRISKLLDYKSAYGVALGGDGRKLQQCFMTYLSEQRSEVSDIIKDNVQTIQVSGESVSVNRSKGLFDPSFPTYVRTMIIFAVIFVLIFIIGAKFECAKKIGWISFKSSDKSSKYKVSRATHLKNFKEEFRHEMSLVVRIFRHNCEKKMSELRIKHRKELEHLAKIKKHGDTGPSYHGPFHQEHLWDILWAKRKYGFTTSLKPKERRGDSLNGFFPFTRSAFSKNKQEVETMV